MKLAKRNNGASHEFLIQRRTSYGPYMPVVEVDLSYGGKQSTISQQFLVDTGASKNFIPHYLVQNLIGEIKKDEMSNTGCVGVNGQPIFGKKVTFGVQFRNTKLPELDLDFWLIRDSKMALLGQDAFFFNFGIEMQNIGIWKDGERKLKIFYPG